MGVAADQCALDGCSAASIGPFCDGHREELLDRLAKAVDELRDVAADIYVGRSSFPERRLLEHCAGSLRTHLLVLHWAASWEESDEIERELIGRCRHLARRTNRSEEASGRHTSPWNAIYVAFRLKHGVRRLPGEIRVSALHWRRRQWPDASVPTRPVLLRAALSPEVAANVVENWRAARRMRPLAGAASATRT